MSHLALLSVPLAATPTPTAPSLGPSQALDLFGWVPGQARADAPVPAAAWVSEGFQMGWDYARYQLTPPADHLHEGHPVRQGWQLGRQRFAQRTLTPRTAVRLWLGLRLSAWTRGLQADHPRLNAHYIGQLLPRCCPITREVLTWGQSQDSDAVVTWLDAGRGVVPGNLAVVSRRALAARSSRDAQALQSLAAEAPAHEAADGWTAERWQRWASLVRAAQVDAQPSAAAHQAAVVQPLTALPPLRVRVSTPALGVQVLLSCCFMGPAYARRMMDLAALLPTAPSRHPYFLLMNALLARRMSAPRGADREALRQVMEDAWRHPIVVQRWQALMQGLRPAQCSQWLQRATQRGLTEGDVRWLDDRDDGWTQAA